MTCSLTRRGLPSGPENKVKVLDFKVAFTRAVSACDNDMLCGFIVDLSQTIIWAYFERQLEIGFNANSIDNQVIRNRFAKFISQAETAHACVNSA